MAEADERDLDATEAAEDPLIEAALLAEEREPEAIDAAEEPDADANLVAEEMELDALEDVSILVALEIRCQFEFVDEG